MRLIGCSPRRRSEDLRHFGNCQVASTIFDNFHSLTDEEDLAGNDRDRFCLFALLPRGALGEGLVALHMLLWKHFIALLVRIELEGEKYDEKQVWAPAWTRLERKILALKYKVDEVVRRAESRGDEPPDMRKRTRCVAPLASFDKEGNLSWNTDLIPKIKMLAGKEKASK